MRSAKLRYVLAAVLVTALLLNPVAGAVRAASSLPDAIGSLRGGPVGDPFRRSASLLGSMFCCDSHACPGAARVEAANIYEPFLGSLKNIISVFLEDEEFKAVLGTVLDEIMADDRIAEYDTGALAVRTLRDERLVEILGSVIADHLREEEFLEALEQITHDFSILLGDPVFASSLQETITALLEDKRTGELVFEAVGQVMIHIDQFKEGLGEKRFERALKSFTGDLAALFEAPLSKYADRVMVDQRMLKALGNIQGSISNHGKQLAENLENDTAFNAALSELMQLLQDPLSNTAEQLTEHLKEELTARGTLLVELLVADLTDLGGFSEETGEYEGIYGETFGNSDSF